jgi:hypothetical protein
MRKSTSKNSPRRNRDITGTLIMDGVVLHWEVRSEPQRNTTNGNIGMRLTVEAEGVVTTRNPLAPKNKAHRELILEYPFEKRQKKASRFPDRPKIDPAALTADIRLAMEAGWEPLSRGRPFVFALYDEEDA